MLQFQAHGIKTSKGVEKCTYMLSSLISGGKCITIYSSKTSCSRFSPEVHQAFDIKNDTDMMTDYFESDLFRVFPSHPLFAEVVEGYKKQLAFRAKRSPRFAGSAQQYLAALNQLAAA